MFYSVSSFLCVFPLFQFFSQLCSGSASSSHVLFPSVLYSSGEPNCLFLRLQFSATSSFSCSHLSAHYLHLTCKLKGHSSAVPHQYLLSGLHHNRGFRTGFNPSCIARLWSASQNMHSTLQNPQVVDKYFSRKVHLAGSCPPYQQIWCHP